MKNKKEDINGSLYRSNSTIDPLLEYYFNKVQDTMKEIITREPYNIDESETNNFVNIFFLNKYVYSADIRDIIKDSFQREHDYDICTTRLLDAYFKKVYNNFYLTPKQGNNTIIPERKTYKTYEQFINESVVSNDGENGFSILLQVMSDTNIKFLSAPDKRYLNTGDNNLFFYSTNIINYAELLSELEDRKSLSATFNTFKSIYNTAGLCIFFAVKDYILTYGLYDISENKVIPTGKFKISTTYLKRITSFDSTNAISSILSNNNLYNLVLLGKIRIDIKEFISKSKVSTIINDKIIIKKYLVTDFKNTATTHEQYLSFFANWVLKKRWNDKVHYYVELDGDEVNFYIKIK